MNNAQSQQTYEEFLAEDALREQMESGEVEEQTEAEATPAATVSTPAVAPIVSEAAHNDEPFPGFNSLPAEIQDTIRKASELKQQHAAMQGRLAPTQRELEAARRQAAEFQRELQKIKAQNAPDPRAAVERLRQIAPDEAEALGAVQQQFMTEQQRWVQEQNAIKAELAELRNERFTARELDKLSKAHPDWQSEVGTPTWEAWAATLPPSRQEQLLATSADDVAILIQDYKRDKALAEMLLKEQEQAAPAAQKRQRPAVDASPISRASAGQPRTGVKPRNAQEEGFAAFLATDNDDD